jgi:hypothetical protein
MGPAIAIGLPIIIKFVGPLLMGLGGKLIQDINAKHGVPKKDDPQKPVIDAKKRQEFRDIITSILQILAGAGLMPAIPADAPEIDGALEMFYRLFKLQQPNAIVPGTPADPSVRVPSASSFAFQLVLTPIAVQA